MIFNKFYVVILLCIVMNQLIKCAQEGRAKTERQLQREKALYEQTRDAHPGFDILVDNLKNYRDLRMIILPMYQRNDQTLRGQLVSLTPNHLILLNSAFGELKKDLVVVDEAAESRRRRSSQLVSPITLLQQNIIADYVQVMKEDIVPKEDFKDQIELLQKLALQHVEPLLLHLRLRDIDEPAQERNEYYDFFDISHHDRNASFRQQFAQMSAILGVMRDYLMPQYPLTQSLIYKLLRTFKRYQEIHNFVIEMTEVRHLLYMYSIDAPKLEHLIQQSLVNHVPIIDIAVNILDQCAQVTLYRLNPQSIWSRWHQYMVGHTGLFKQLSPDRRAKFMTEVTKPQKSVSLISRARQKKKLPSILEDFEVVNKVNVRSPYVRW
ncbi:hypothetical protein MIR68_009761 [Amoeboaphelidium protococcarum]|nr:hypothetical protein MIR68_009761 [Amoeboaphelidium protococcarum]